MSACALVYAALVAVLGRYPFWRHLTPDRALIVAAPGCGLAGSLLASVRASPAVAEKVLPVIMASNLTRGPEVGASGESCTMIAEDIRANAPWTAAIPTRFLCSSVRRYVRSRYLEEHLVLGGHILVAGGRAHGTWGYVDELRRRGLTWVRDDGGFRLVAIPSDAPPPSARHPAAP